MPPPTGAPVPAGVATLFDQGRSANSAGRPAQAEGLLREALAALEGGYDVATGTGTTGHEPEAAFPSVGDGPADAAEAWVRVCLSLSTALVERRGLGAAATLVQDALDVATRLEPAAVRDALVALCHSQLGVLYGRSGRSREALVELDRAAVHLDALGPRERFPILLGRGYLRLDLPDPVAAEADFAAAAELAAQHDLARQEFMARHNQGLAVAAAGDLPRALSLMLATDRLAVDISRAPAWHGRGLVLLEAGLVQEGVELLERATAAALEEGQELQAGQSLVDLAQGQLLLDDAAAASETARRARRALARAGAPALGRRAALVQLTARLAAGAAARRIAARSAELVADFDQDGDHVAADLARLLAAEALSLAGDHDAAVDTLGRAADLTRVGSLATRMRSRAVLAAAARSRQDLRAARRHVRAALQDVSLALSGSASLELRAATTTHARVLERLDLELAGDRPAARLAAVERWNEVAALTPAVRPPADPGLAQRVSTLRHLRHQVAEDPGLAGELRGRLRSLERQVAADSWAAVGAGGGPQARLEPGRLREALAGLDAVAVSLSVLDDRLGAAVLDRRRTRWVDLGPLEAVSEAVRRFTADLEARSRVASGPMVTAVDAALQRSALAVDDLLLRPLRVTGRLVVVPTPLLSGIAWGMLPSRRGLPTTTAPSLGSWVRGAWQVRAPRAAVLPGPGLPGALEECATVADVWGLTAPAGHARSDDLAARVAEVDLVHVAAHGSHRSDSPLFSSLWLEDGPVFLAELERVDRVASQVVVSACEAGRVHGRGGATLGLASGLLSLGVSSVIASPCRVPDATAATVMGRYHRSLATGTAADEALATAAASSDLPLAGAFVAWGAPWSSRGAHG